MSQPLGDSPGLGVQGLTIRFGGNTAVDAAAFEAPLGRITGLIGPNGAGKTTIFNACSGLLRPSEGEIRLFEKDVTGRPPSARAQLGLGRTFQQMDLFDSLTVEQNIAIGREARLAGSHPLKQLLCPPAERKAVRQATEEVLELCGIRELRHEVAGSLSTGQRRLVDLGRVLAGGFSMLLLDEPSSGLDTAETGRFGAIVTRVVAERCCGVLLVEHDMALVMSVCDYLYVLDFGQMIFQGTPAEVRASEAVRAAYLGTEAA
ncbi:ABC transporter ATP-binding protein [Streptomyces sp. PSKA54]|uniref:ABC transporter ATP-binding protein n=1 Tax=Streptomyces himalayensis subsp. aureolus TaxID=2758039 RepID=A0A7W2HH95_9ACTN|nr:ABC transporter ATP-binding protein [Streptomyces himalayensis]MBA4863792.1 ABC transporter ATP-binding protein [Streptomyces himalayensis subsp. aureolus]